jgi:2-polyprenyl-3-methyl-5-hydroxy-6-metoxy-1,4-benzoquinol methylase
MNETLDSNYEATLSQSILRVIPEQALRILEVGCGQGQLGAALKRANPQRYVVGVETELEAAKVAAESLDQVFVTELEQELQGVGPGSFDCILFGDVLQRTVEPKALLSRYRRLLSPSGKIFCAVPNVQHCSMLMALLSGDFQYTDSGILKDTYLRFFSHSTLQKLLLDAGFTPRLRDVIQTPVPPKLATLLSPLVGAIGVNLERTMSYLQAYRYIVEGTPLPDVPNDVEAEPLTLIVCVSDDGILANNFLASPDLREQQHDVILLRNCRSAADGYALGIEKARHSLVVCAHQDVYLPKGWSRRVVSQYRNAERQLGPIGVAGVFGVDKQGESFRRIGRVVDRDNLLDVSLEYPAKVHSLDELLLVVPKNTELRFDAALGFHFYGADLCLSAAAQGLPAIVLDALCLHNSRTSGHNSAFYQSARVFVEKWREELPIATPCVRLSNSGEMSAW